MQHRLGDGHALLHPLGELAYALVRPLGHLHRLQHLLGAAGDVLLAHPPDLAQVGQGLVRRQVWVELWGLHHGTNLGQGLLGVLHHVDAVERGGASAGRQQIGQYLDGSGLPCPVGAEEAEEGPLAHRQAEIVHGAEAIEVLGQTLNHNRISQHLSSFGSCDYWTWIYILVAL